MLTPYLWTAWRALMSAPGHTLAMVVIGLCGLWAALALWRTAVDATRWLRRPGPR